MTAFKGDVIGDFFFCHMASSYLLMWLSNRVHGAGFSSWLCWVLCGSEGREGTTGIVNEVISSIGIVNEVVPRSALLRV